MWKYVVVLTVVLLHICVESTWAQGMMPVAPVVDHPPKQGATGGGGTGPLSKEKIQNHMKIATSHLSSEKQNVEDDQGSDQDAASATVFRKDKPVDLQNPSKHAAEDFILPFLLSQYPRSETEEERVEILQNLENFSHKFENGRELFMSTNALKDILLPALNSSSEAVRKSACSVFAIAGQNNPEVKSVVLQAGVIRILVQLISFDQSVRSKALYALASLVRNYPQAQANLIKDGGVPSLVKVASYSETRKRSLSFVTDLLQERNYCRTSQHDNNDPKSDDGDLYTDPCDEFKVLEKTLGENGWCDVLSDSIRNIPGLDLDDQITTLEATKSSLSFCMPSIQPQRRILSSLLATFEKDQDFADETQIVRDIMTAIDNFYSTSKEEL